MGKRSYIWNLSKEEIQHKVDNCNSIHEMLSAFGFSPTSGNMYKTMKDVIEYFDIDTSHFGTLYKPKPHPKYTLDEILVENSTYGNIHKLKERLLEANLLKYKCDICGNPGFWNGKDLSLQLDHINGNHFDHRLENLRFLCPNCHSQTEFWAGKNNGKYKNLLKK